MSIIPRWPVSGLFNIAKLYGLPCVTVLKSVPFLEHLQKFNLDLCILKDSNSLQVSCLGMNPERGWNPNLEGSYILEYSEYEAKNFTQGTWRIYLQPINVLAPDPSPILRYRKCTKTFCFSILGFFKPGVKLGFEFLRVLPNQKSQPWSLNFDFEESNPMLGSLKNSSSVESPNFPQQKLKMPEIKFCFDKKMRPSMES